MQSIDSMKQFGSSEGTGALMHTEEDPVQMPLGLGPVGDDPGADLSASSDAMGPGKSRGALLLVGVLLIAGGTLYGMRLTGGVDGHDAKLADAEKKIDQALKRFGADAGNVDPSMRQNIDAIFKDTETVLAKFGEDPTSRQVDLDHVQKNPFALVLLKREKGPTAAAVQAIDKVKEQRLKELRKELDLLKLQSLMNGKVALAVINGKVTREGDTIGSFTITSIGPSGVKLAAEGNLYTLAMKKPEDLNQ